MEEVLSILAHKRVPLKGRPKRGGRRRTIVISPAEQRKQDETRLILADLIGASFDDVKNGGDVHIGGLLGAGAYGVVLKGDMQFANGKMNIAVKVPFRDAADSIAEEIAVFEQLGMVVGTDGLTKIMEEEGWAHVPLVTCVGSFSAMVQQIVTPLIVLSRYKQSLAQACHTGDNTGLDLVEIGCSVVSGLEFLHERLKRFGRGSTTYMVHRDVSSSNILLDEQGRASLGDFGAVVTYCDTPGQCPGEGYEYVRGFHSWVTDEEAALLERRFLYASRRTDVVCALLCVMDGMLPSACQTSVWRMATEEKVYTADGMGEEDVCALVKGSGDGAGVHRQVMKCSLFTTVVELLALSCTDKVDYGKVRDDLRG